MILSAVIMIVLAVILLAYVLEPVLRAADDQVEIDAAFDAEPVPDFRALLEDEDHVPEAKSEESRTSIQQPEPAEHRS